MNKTKTKEDNNPRISPTLIEIIKWDVIERKGQKILLTRFRDNKFTIIRPDEKRMVEEEYAAEKNGALKLLKETVYGKDAPWYSLERKYFEITQREYKRVLGIKRYEEIKWK